MLAVLSAILPYFTSTAKDCRIDKRNVLAVRDRMFLMVLEVVIDLNIA
jgi:hypothetical protein